MQGLICQKLTIQNLMIRGMQAKRLALPHLQIDQMKKNADPQ